MKEKKGLILLVLNIAVLILVVSFTIGNFVLSDNRVDVPLKKACAAESNSVSEFEDLKFSFRNVVKDVLPSVVQVETVNIQKTRVSSSPFEWFFGKPKDDEEGEEQEFRQEGMGSGVIIRKDSNEYFVLTNNHVVEGSEEITIRLNNKKEYDAQLVGTDPRTDVAVVKFKTNDKNIVVATIGDSDYLEVGDIVLAIGSPFGFTSSVTQGIVSGKGRKGPRGNLTDFIQTDAAINSGNSGGALVDINGNLIGINTWIATRTGESAGLGFSIPINSIMSKINSIIKTGSVEYGWFGVSITDANDEYFDMYDLKKIDGALVSSVYLNSAAATAGIKAGDYIIRIDSRKIVDSNDLVKVVSDFKVGDVKTVYVYRNGKPISLKIKIAKRSSEKKINDNIKFLWPGIVVSEFTDEIEKYFNIEKQDSGLVVLSVIEDTKFYIGGLRQGDIITSINGKDINSLKDFYNAIGEDTNKYSIEYVRKGETLFFGIKK